MKLLNLFFIFFLFSPISAFSQSKLLKSKGILLKIDVPKDWEYFKNFNKIPHFFISPDHKKIGNSSLSIRFLEKTPKVDKLLANILKEEIKYQEAKSKWAKSLNAKINSFVAYEKLLAKKGVIIHKFGVNFILGKDNLWDYSYFLDCNGVFVKIKGFYSNEQKEHLKVIENSINSIKCNIKK
jgi:hypothetical protein